MCSPATDMRCNLFGLMLRYCGTCFSTSSQNKQKQKQIILNQASFPPSYLPLDGRCTQVEHSCSYHPNCTSRTYCFGESVALHGYPCHFPNSCKQCALYGHRHSRLGLGSRLGCTTCIIETHNRYTKTQNYSQANPCCIYIVDAEIDECLLAWMISSRHQGWYWQNLNEFVIEAMLKIAWCIFVLVQLCWVHGTCGNRCCILLSCVRLLILVINYWIQWSWFEGC